MADLFSKEEIEGIIKDARERLGEELANSKYREEFEDFLRDMLSFVSNHPIIEEMRKEGKSEDEIKVYAAKSLAKALLESSGSDTSFIEDL